MCGIIGYTGPRACKELLLAGLERLADLLLDGAVSAPA